MGGGGGGMEELTEDEKRALRGSKFAPLTSLPSSSRSQLPSSDFHVLAHPGGPMKTNKAAALAKFLERKLQDPNVLSSIDPDLIELAVKNSRHIISSRTSSSGRRIQHVVSFVDVEVSSDDDKIENTKLSKKKKKKKKKKNKKHKVISLAPFVLTSSFGLLFVLPTQFL
ncbi:uncharacterized protein LOC103846208 isoform X1 [Brassica rapa]|uniref:uncharacterized protein LOC103846208 isoform X1 n=1 Tax=Brassica campestris TaxID=3711 RepID=UPI00142D8012|nr:uncharacterized protein LOC103846208 isoform X1 [Brassica rapa]